MTALLRYGFRPFFLGAGHVAARQGDLADAAARLGHASPTSRIRGVAEGKALIVQGPTPGGLHYREVAVAAWATVIFGGGWAGNVSPSCSSSSFRSGSGRG